MSDTAVTCSNCGATFHSDTAFITNARHVAAEHPNPIVAALLIGEALASIRLDRDERKHTFSIDATEHPDPGSPAGLPTGSGDTIMSPIAIRGRDQQQPEPPHGPQRSVLGGIRVPTHWRTREDLPNPSPQAYLRGSAGSGSEKSTS